MASFEFDHMSVVVHDLEAVTQFFVALGFRCEGRAELGGTWVDRIIGLEGTQVKMAMVSAPDGSGKLELSEFQSPVPADDRTELPANAHGYRHIAFRVPDIEAVLAKAQAAGYGTMGDVVDYEDIYRLAYIRGPEGLIVEVAQPLR